MVDTLKKVAGNFGKKDGRKLIDSTILGFSKIIQNLDNGINQNKSAVEKNNAQRAILDKDTADLETNTKKAENFKNNLAKLLQN